MAEREGLLEELRRSKETLGPVYPVILSETGEVIDGLHRLKVDPNWPKVQMPVRDRAKILAARLVVNSVRRVMPEEEKREILREMAKILIERGVKPGGELINKIIELTGFSQRWVYQYLPDEFKKEYHKLKNTKIARHAILIKTDQISENKQGKQEVKTEVEESEGEEVVEDEGIVRPPSEPGFPFEHEGRVLDVKQIPGNRFVVSVEGLDKPILITPIQYGYNLQGRLKVGDVIAFKVEGESGGIYEVINPHFVLTRTETKEEETSTLSEESEEVREEEEKEVEVSCVVSEVRESLLDTLEQTFGFSVVDYYTEDSGTVTVLRRECGDGVIEVALRVVTNKAVPSANKPQVMREEPKPESKREEERSPKDPKEGSSLGPSKGSRAPEERYGWILDRIRSMGFISERMIRSTKAVDWLLNRDDVTLLFGADEDDGDNVFTFEEYRQLLERKGSYIVCSKCGKRFRSWKLGLYHIAKDEVRK